jgi:hypothetical protein
LRERRQGGKQKGETTEERKVQDVLFS